MMEMSLQPGSIMIWKEYSTWQLLMRKLLRKNKPLPFNKCAIVFGHRELIDRNETFEPLWNGEILIYEPKKRYSTKEAHQLNEIRIREFDRYKDWKQYQKNPISCLRLLNEVRPSTFNMEETTLVNVGENKYYKKVYAKKIEN